MQSEKMKRTNHFLKRLSLPSCIENNTREHENNTREQKHDQQRKNIAKTEYKQTKIGDDGYREKSEQTRSTDQIGKMKWSLPPSRALRLRKKRSTLFHLKKYKSMSSAQKQHSEEQGNALTI